MSNPALFGNVRKFVLMIGASGFLAVQLALQDYNWAASSQSTLLAAVGLALWGLVLLFAMGPWLWGRQLEDERTSLTRHRAFFFGYIAMVLVGASMFALAILGVVAAPEAIHLTLALGIAVPIYGFAFLE